LIFFHSKSYIHEQSGGQDETHPSQAGGVTLTLSLLQAKEVKGSSWGISDVGWIEANDQGNIIRWETI
jgi:hypothetical protein